MVVGFPRFTQKPPAKARFEIGTTMKLNCSAAGDPEPVITWRKEVGQLPAGRTVMTKESLTISDLKMEDSGKYVCMATSAAVSGAVAQAHLQVFRK